MPGTDAERARRYRRHRRGDHSLCAADRCEAVVHPPPLVTQRDTATAGDVSAGQSVVTERGPRGQRLWDELAGDGLPPLQRVLLDEACRMADRLDRLDALLEGRAESWLSVTVSDDGDLRLVIDGLLAETRQQATALRGLVAELLKAVPKGRAPARTGAAPAALPKGIALLKDQAAKRRPGVSA